MRRFLFVLLSLSVGCECGGRERTSADGSIRGADVPQDVPYDYPGWENVPIVMSVNDPYDPATWMRPTPVPLPMAPGSGPAPVPGWRESSVPLCAEYTGDAQAHDVLATAEGVYSQVTIVNNPLAMAPAWDRPWGRMVYFNDGTGWVERAFVPSDYASGGFVATSTGTVYLAQVGCGVVRVPAGPSSFQNVHCALTRPRYNVGTLLAVTPGDAVYALALDYDGRADVHRDRGAGFERVAELPRLPDASDGGVTSSTWYTALAAWDSGFIVGTSVGQVLVFDGAHLVEARAPNGERVSRIFVSGPGDVWLASGVHLDHFDGETFTRKALPETCGAWDLAMYASGDTLYYVQSTAFGRIVGEDVEVIADLPCTSKTRFRGISGTSPTDVFVTMENRDFIDYACGTTFMGYFDGTVMHRL